MNNTRNEHLRDLLNSMIRERMEPGFVYNIRKKILKEVMAEVKAGADVNIKNDKGKTALMYAQTAEETYFFIKAGADVNATDNKGRTALMYAQGFLQTELLLKAGADAYKKGWFRATFTGEKILLNASRLARTTKQYELLKQAMVRQWPIHIAKQAKKSIKQLLSSKFEREDN